MTAPDVNADVRARFEASYLNRRGVKEPSDRMRHWLFRRSGEGYADGCTDAEWEGYRAAHADLAGEVRELVEALQKLAAYPLEEFALEEKPERKLFGANDWELHAKDVLDARAALAKFHPTHQETK